MPNPNTWVDPLGLAGENVFIHYTDKVGFESIMKTGVLRPNAAGKVYITDILMSPKDVMRDLLINDSLHIGRGDYAIIFKADNHQLSNIVRNSEFEYIHSGKMKIGDTLYTGKNPYGVISDLPYEQRLRLSQEQMKYRGKKCLKK
ncbi:hypothetical protein BVY05_22420 [Pectobacterium odoriferum]|nr:hypothetical protein [Pectobacterium odoriferum]POD96703.1 hypothetical protein BVY05_22420 [Pectobacterium odoriferum]